MIAKSYSAADKDLCLALFDSNSGLYFAADERDEFLKFLDRQALDGNYFTFRTHGMISACGGFARIDDHYVLTWGMVARHLHGKGLGTEIVRYRIQQICAQDPARKIRIDTSQHTEPFYEKMGFKKTGIEPDGFDQGLHRVTMELICNAGR